jgi:hypothetical protein
MVKKIKETSSSIMAFNIQEVAMETASKEKDL